MIASHWPSAVNYNIYSWYYFVTSPHSIARRLSSLPLSSISCANCCRHFFVMNISVEWKFVLSIEGILIRESISSIFAWPPPVLTNPHTDATLIEWRFPSRPLNCFGCRSTMIEIPHSLHLKDKELYRPYLLISRSILGDPPFGQHDLWFNSWLISLLSWERLTILFPFRLNFVAVFRFASFRHPSFLSDVLLFSLLWSAIIRLAIWADTPLLHTPLLLPPIFFSGLFACCVLAC